MIAQAIIIVTLAIDCFYALLLISQWIPQAPSPLTATLFDIYRSGMIPERDLLLYRVLIVLALSLTGIIFTIQRLKGQLWSTRTLRQMAGVNLIATLIVSMMLFKTLVFRGQIWLTAFYVSLGAAFLLVIFFPEVKRFIDFIDGHLRDGISPLVKTLLSISVVIVLIAFMWVPDIEGAVARAFIGEQFHHLDWLIMPASWAHLSGNIIGIDQTTRYGLGAPVIVAEITQRLLGGFSYESVMTVMMIAAVVYIVLWFFVFKRFYSSMAWAAIAIFLGLRLQFFDSETFPFVFTYPQLNPLRVFMDVVVFYCLIRVIDDNRKRWLYLASIACGLAIYNISGDGLYLLTAFYAFLAIALIKNPSTKTALLKTAGRHVIAWFTLPFFALAIATYLTVGSHAFKPLFWQNLFEYIWLYGQGLQSAPIINNLKSGFILEAGMGFMLPALYVFLLIWLMLRWLNGLLPKQGWVVITALVYLLANYQYQAMVSNNTTGYLRLGVIIALVGVWCVAEALKGVMHYHQRIIKLGLGVLIIFGTVTTHQFLLHPNVLNFSKNPMTHPPVTQSPMGRFSYFNHLFISFPETSKVALNSLGQKDEMLLIENNFADDKALKQFYRQEINYAKDAALIDSLTKPNEKVPLISSFEVAILMQAKRPPFFYTFDLINSRPRRMRNFTVTLLYSVDNFRREAKLLETYKPKFVFLEKIYLTKDLPASYRYDSQDLMTLLDYVFEKYEPYQEGEFLVALKRHE